MTNWAAPYAYLALSDYVIQVASVVADEKALKEFLSKFASQNPELHRRTIDRAINYWYLNWREGLVDGDYHSYPPYNMLKSLV
jgi:hypothetical protein